MTRWGAGFCIALFGARKALAHDGAPPAPHDVWSAWNWASLTLLGIALAACAYTIGVRRLWRHAGAGHGVRRWQAWTYAGGLFALFVALISPLDALGTALFSVHMVQHLVLVLIAAPLLVLGRPVVPLLWALKGTTHTGKASNAARSTLRLLRSNYGLPVILVLHVAALWIWHVPSFYQAALQSQTIHGIEHAAFFGTALLFWWAVILPGGRTRYGASILALFLMAMQGSLLGALMTFSPAPWYPAYARSVAAWGLTPLEDQQIAGLTMWVPPGVINVIVASALVVIWLDDRERTSLDAHHPQEQVAG